MVKLLLFLNKFFKQRSHPFNQGGKYKLNYADFEYKSASNVFSDFEIVLGESIKKTVQDKIVLDLGCGAGGKSVFLKESGAREVFGVDLSETLISQAKDFSKKQTDINFEIASVSKLSFKDNTFDILIANDIMEHISSPDLMLREAYRVLKKGGKLFINFEPYYHFLGHHMWDVINIPWVHIFFSEKTRIKAYKELVKALPDAQARIDFRIDKKENGEEYIGYLNKMTLNHFEDLLKKSNFSISLQKSLLINKFPFKYFVRTPFLREFSTLKKLCILEKL